MLRRKLIDVEKFRLHLNAVNESMDLHQGGWQFVSQAVMIGGIASSQSSWWWRRVVLQFTRVKLVWWAIPGGGGAPSIGGGIGGGCSLIVLLYIHELQICGGRLPIWSSHSLVSLLLRWWSHSSSSYWSASTIFAERESNSIYSVSEMGMGHPDRMWLSYITITRSQTLSKTFANP